MGNRDSFGKYTGKFDILRSLASLSYDGRRTTFFQKELKNSLKIIDNGHFPKKTFTAHGQVLLVKLNLCQVHL